MLGDCLETLPPITRHEGHDTFPSSNTNWGFYSQEKLTSFHEPVQANLKVKVYQLLMCGSSGTHVSNGARVYWDTFIY